MKIDTDKFYDKTDKSSIEQYGKRLLDGTLATVPGVQHVPAELVDLTVGVSSKGMYGKMVENYFYGIYPPNTSEPDFPEAGVDVKSTPVLPHRHRKYSPKERLVLNKINYKEEAALVFGTSSYLKKNAHIMLFAYLHERDVPLVNLVIKLAFMFSYEELPEIDKSIIMADWMKIHEKIKKGEAHLLSEGDTLYLGACTKGVNRDDLEDQGVGRPRAKRRAYCYKQGYMGTIIDRELKKPVVSSIEPILKPGTALAPGQTFEDAVLEALYRYRHMNVTDIHTRIAGDLNIQKKDYFAALARRMLGVKKNKIEEFEKANVTMKVLRLKPSGMPKESVSFPYFHWMDVVKDDYFEEELQPIFEKRFLFVVFQCWDKNCAVREKLYFSKAFFWTMPTADIEGDLYKTWLDVKQKVSAGQVDQLPTSSGQPFHIRPHGRDSHDVIPLPTGGFKTKHSFWISAGYLKKMIETSEAR